MFHVFECKTEDNCCTMWSETDHDISLYSYLQSHKRRRIEIAREILKIIYRPGGKSWVIHNKESSSLMKATIKREIAIINSYISVYKEDEYTTFLQGCVSYLEKELNQG